MSRGPIINYVQCTHSLKLNNNNSNKNYFNPNYGFRYVPEREPYPKLILELLVCRLRDPHLYFVKISVGNIFLVF